MIPQIKFVRNVFINFDTDCGNYLCHKTYFKTLLIDDTEVLEVFIMQINYHSVLNEKNIELNELTLNELTLDFNFQNFTRLVRRSY